MERCRVCLTASPLRKLLPLDTKLPRDEVSRTHLECLRRCTQLEVPVAAPPHDFKYPMQICLRCSKSLQVAHHFIRLAHESDAALRSEAAEAAHVYQIKAELMAVEALAVAASSAPCAAEMVDLTSYFREISTEEAEAATQAERKMTNTKNAFSSQFSDFVKTYDVITPHQIANADVRLDRISPSVDKNTQNDKNAVAHNETILAVANVDLLMDMEEECDKNDTLEDAIKILTDDIESATQEGDSTPGDRNVLAKIDNQFAAPIASKTAMVNGNLNESAQKFIEEIKENLYNGARDYALSRNKAKVLDETAELQKAFETKEAEIDDNNELVCVECKMRFSDMRTFIRHRNRHKGITPFRCDSCNFFTCYAESMRKHYKRYHDIEATNDMLSTVMDPKNKPIEKPYVEKTHRCTICDYQTNKTDAIQEHVGTKHPLQVDSDSPVDSLFTIAYNCPDCHRMFKDQKHMRTHFTLTHGSAMGVRKLSTETYICEHCDKQFHHKVSLISHQRVCRLREAVRCHICDKKLVSVRVFEQHLRADHNVETIHECEVCSKTFNSREALFMHRKRHTERHFQCTICSKTYVNNSELNVHIARIHSTGANVQCRTCGRSFRHVTLLREHEQKQHIRKMVKCQYCEYTSPWRCGVRLHEYVHTGKPYKCKTCGREFALRSYLRNHSISAHSITPSENEMAKMFRNKFGYPSRYDVFSAAKNNLEIDEINEDDIEQELKEFGLKFDDIVNELFENGFEQELFNLGA